MSNIKFLILRRISQITLLLLYVGGNIWGWKMLQGNLSGSLVLGIIPLADPYMALQIFATGSILATDALIGAGIIFLFYSLIGGRAFCSWVCPMNMVTDLSNWLRKKIKNDIGSEKRVLFKRSVRYWILGISLVISALMGVAAFEFINPISMLYRGLIFGFGFGFAVVLVVFLFDLFVLPNGWCGHICPLGAFYSLIGKFSFLRVKYDLEKCTECMDCKLICPEKQVLSIITKENGFILSGECTNCGRCIDVCNDDALNFSIRNFLQKDNKEGEVNEIK